MAVYDLTHTAAQIDETATKVLTTGEIAKMVRDEVKAQLSSITGGASSVPVFDSTSVMKQMTIPNLAASVGESMATTNVDTINTTFGIFHILPSVGGTRAFTVTHFLFHFQYSSTASTNGKFQLAVRLNGEVKIRCAGESGIWSNWLQFTIT